MTSEPRPALSAVAAPEGEAEAEALAMTPETELAAAPPPETTELSDAPMPLLEADADAEAEAELVIEADADPADDWESVLRSENTKTRTAIAAVSKLAETLEAEAKTPEERTVETVPEVTETRCPKSVRVLHRWGRLTSGADAVLESYSGGLLGGGAVAV
jgi:hypothetical protein